ncbi:hypothetical protein Tco_0681918 [Tanacetum coccineum]|uniref:Uncharacterized protein n=1 Tax=Tanacetum coccineum TaxID=301880 RepID=A0ABQ4XPP1_9ASTR
MLNASIDQGCVDNGLNEVDEVFGKENVAEIEKGNCCNSDMVNQSEYKKMFNEVATNKKLDDNFHSLQELITTHKQQQSQVKKASIWKKRVKDIKFYNNDILYQLSSDPNAYSSYSSKNVFNIKMKERYIEEKLVNVLLIK